MQRIPIKLAIELTLIPSKLCCQGRLDRRSLSLSLPFWRIVQWTQPQCFRLEPCSVGCVQKVFVLNFERGNLRSNFPVQSKRFVQRQIALSPGFGWKLISMRQTPPLTDYETFALQMTTERGLPLWSSVQGISTLDTICPGISMT